jgi:hypothetical protein
MDWLMADDCELGLFELFENKGELLPLWLRFRASVESLGDDVRVKPRERFAEFDRRGAEFTIAEPTSHHRIEVGLHNPGLPYDSRFRAADGFGSRRITHRMSLPENAQIDDALHARLHAAYALAWDAEPR